MISLDPRLDAAEVDLLRAVSADELIAFTAQVSTDVRLSGSPEELRALQRAEAQLASWGFHTAARPRWVYQPARARAVGSGRTG